jgi:hypothetical protein
MFSGAFLLSPFSVNDSCYGSDGRLISLSILYIVEKYAPFSYKIFYDLLISGEKFYQCKSEHKPGYHICASCMHGSLFLLIQDTNAEHLIIENST